MKNTAFSHDRLSDFVATEEMSATTIIDNALHAILEVKGKDPTVLKIPQPHAEYDYLVVVSARSDRQAQGISNRVIDQLSDQGCKPIAVEGMETGQWVLLDYGDVVIHVFYEPMREHYDIEGLWSNATVVNNI